MNKPMDIIGKKFNRLTVLELVGTDKYGNTKFLCECDCGKRKVLLGSKVKGNDYRSIDIGIATAYLTAEATAQGLGTCILGWFDDKKLRDICGLKNPVRLVVSLGYPKKENSVPTKKRKSYETLVSEV